LTIVVIVIAWLMYIRKKEIPAAESAQLNPVHKLVYKKYFVDEIYDTILVKPLFWISEKLEVFVEKIGIDGIVNSVGVSVVDGSKATRLIQTGNIGFYIFAMVISIAMILAAIFYIK
jgi:NADH-quinone oxidoreductase subunit L